jgi:nucleoside-triphosphatase THEP1
MGNIYILTGEIKSGKTTSLMKWASAKNNIGGIFQPVVNGKRFIYDISSRTLRNLEIDLKFEGIKIGKYNFDKNTFDWAQNVLLDSLSQNMDWLIIDEVGPLELEGKGLEPVISKILKERQQLKTKIIFVVRSAILEKFIEHYGIQNNFNLFEFPDQ